MQIVITCRAIIIHEGKLLMCKHNEPDRSFYNLPGGKLELSESIDACMEREMFEETGIKPTVGKLLFINQLIVPSRHRIEFFFQINNHADYFSFDPSKASHSFEVSDFVFADPTDPAYDLKPRFLIERFDKLVEKGDDFITEIILSH
jgi:ADP-ribose pyrophosphatase YjhB (NUDIX family)